MLTTDELKRVAEMAQAEIHAELHEMWSVVATSHISPGMVRAIVKVLAREFGIRRGANGQHIEEKQSVAVEQITLPPDLNGERRQTTLLKAEAAPRPKPIRTVTPKPQATPGGEDDRNSWAKKLDLTGEAADLVGRLERREISWRSLSNQQRWPIVAAFIQRMQAVGHRVTQVEADRTRPWWMPTSQAWCQTLGVAWTELVAAAKRNRVDPPTSKAE